MLSITRVVSASTTVYADVEETKVCACKCYPNRVAESYAAPKEAVVRMLSFGNTGLRVFSEELAKRLDINYELAKEIATEIRADLFKKETK